MGLVPLGAPLAPQSVFGYNKYNQSAPKITKGAKATPKCSTSNPQGRKMGSYKSAKVVQVHEKSQLQDTRPGGLREALTITLYYPQALNFRKTLYPAQETLTSPHL